MPSATWPEKIIDPHIHQWNPFTTPRQASGRAKILRPLPRIPDALTLLAPRSDREFIGTLQFLLKPYLPSDYQRDTDLLPVHSVVHIEAAWAGAPAASVDETTWVTRLPFGDDGAPRLGAVIAHVDPRWRDAAEILDRHLEASPLVRGIRHSVTHHEDPRVRDFDASPDALAQPAFLDGFAAVAERGLSMELWLYAHQLPTATNLVHEYPQTTFVLNHYATPVGVFGPRGKYTGQTATNRASILDRWRDDVAELAEHPNVVAKHSGLGMPLLGGMPAGQVGDDELTERAAPLVRHLHDCFGAHRTMWASNYPIDKPVLSLPATAQILLDVLGADADPQLLFRDVAARTYRIDERHNQP